jgi:hypothetical protein
VVAGKRKASSAPLAQGRLRSLNGASHFVGPPIYRERSLDASASLRRRRVDIGSGKKFFFPESRPMSPEGFRRVAINDNAGRRKRFLFPI